MNVAEIKSLLASVTVDQVMSVYSGKAGRCYCGCSGNHRYASKRFGSREGRGMMVPMESEREEVEVNANPVTPIVVVDEGE